MSAISTYLHQIITAIWAKDVRQAIHDAISQCYDDVNAPALQTEAMQAAVQAKIDAGEMAALTIADGSLTGAKLANGTIPTAKIADGAVTTIKIADGAVTGAKVGTGTLTGDNIANKAIGTTKIGDGAVTWQKLASGAVHTGGLADSAVTNVKLADSSVSEGKLASGSVTTEKIADGAITADKLSSDIDFDVETDTTLTQSGVPADAKTVGEKIVNLKADLSESESIQKLLHDNVPGTIQNYTFTDGTVSKVEHKSGNDIVRSDVFTYGESSITEVRTLATGEALTIVTNLTNLETSVTYTVA